jgi:hypothetical protein
MQRGLMMRLRSRHESTQCRNRERDIWSSSDHQIHQCTDSRTVAGPGGVVESRLVWTTVVQVLRHVLDEQQSVVNTLAAARTTP